MIGFVVGYNRLTCCNGVARRIDLGRLFRVANGLLTCCNSTDNRIDLRRVVKIANRLIVENVFVINLRESWGYSRLG